MNNFTKEELQYLHGAIYERPHYVSEQMDSMRNKIQSMIDNYCDCIDTEDFTDTIIKCVNCSKIKGYSYE